MSRQSAEDFRAMKLPPHEAMMVDTHHCASVQTPRMHSTKRDPPVHDRVRVM